MTYIFKYQLDFKPETNEFKIPKSNQNMKFSSILQKINKIHNRSDLTNILFNGSQIDLNTKLDDFYEPESIFMIYGDLLEFNVFSNIDFSSMRTPTKIKLSPNSSQEEIIQKITKVISKRKSRFTSYGLSFYISGGIKLESDLLTFLLTYHPQNLNLYVVLTPDVNLANLKSRQEFLNPYNLSKTSQMNITCLAEYLHLNGSKGMDLTYTVSSIVNFPPLPIIFLSLMQRGLTREPFFHFISLLQTLFLGIDPTIKPENVFEKTPYFCQYIISQYANSNFFSNLNGRIVFAPDFHNNVSNPFNDLWQPPTTLSLYKNNSTFHVFPTNSIIRSDCPCFAKNGLLLIDKKYQKNIFYNPITKEVIEKKIISQFTRILSAKEMNPDIKQSNVNQTTVFLIDCSDHLKTDQLEQIERKILQVYNDNANRYRTSSLNAMMSFGFRSLVLSKMDIYDPNFAFRSRAAQVKGKSNIYEAINDAVDYLNAFNWDEKGIAYPNAKYRIVLVTSGYNDDDEDEKSTKLETKQKPKPEPKAEQEKTTKNKVDSKSDKKSTKNSSFSSKEQKAEDQTNNKKGDDDDVEDGPIKITYEDIKSKLLESEVLLDSLVMRKNSPFTPTIAKLCHYTGGSCIIVDNEQLAKSVITQEAFLNIEFRKEPIFGDDSSETCDVEFPNDMKIEGEMKTKLITVDQSLPKPSNNLTRRILQEFEYIKKLKEDCFHVFMVDNNLQQWRVFIKAPPKSHLNGKWLYLLIFFPDDYPLKPPQFKFISIPYHINISNEGRICMNYLDYEYNSTLTVAYMIICILELLESPNYDDPIDVERKKLYNSNPKKFLELTKESAKYGKDTVEDWLKELQE